MSELAAYHVRALVILKRNIQSLLDQRKESQVALARHVHHSKAWINKFLNDQTDRTEIQIRDVDLIASFFGLEPYQLFQPGINRLTERRSGIDRRDGIERRVGHSGRELASLRTEINKHPALASRGSSPPPHSSAPPDPLQRLIERFAREIHVAIHSRSETPTPRPNGTTISRDRRKSRRSTAKPA